MMNALSVKWRQVRGTRLLVTTSTVLKPAAMRPRSSISRVPERGGASTLRGASGRDVGGGGIKAEGLAGDILVSGEGVERDGNSAIVAQLLPQLRGHDAAGAEGVGQGFDCERFAHRGFEEIAAAQPEAADHDALRIERID